MALVQAGDSTVKEEEIEQTTETTLSETTKDLGDTQMMEKAASFHGQQTSKVVEETGSSTQNVEASAKDQTNENIQQLDQQKPPQQSLPDIYKPLEPVKKFEPLQPFAPLNQFEAPKSFELAKQIEANIQFEAAKEDDTHQQQILAADNEADISKTESENVSKNTDDLTRPFEFIKPLELPESIATSNQYQPLKPFDATSNDETVIENVEQCKDNVPSKEIPESQDAKVKSDVNKLKEEKKFDLIQEDNPRSGENVPEQDAPLKEPFEMRTSTGELYVPVIALEPLNLDDYLKPIVVDTDQNSHAEIKQDKIKESLKEIISDLDTYAEKDKELKESLRNENNSNDIRKRENIEIQKQCASGTHQDKLIVRLPCCVSPHRQRPLSLPSENLLSLIKYAQIAQELNKVTQNNNNEQDENAVPKPSISLEKLFTPAEDAPQISPSSSRKMFASSSFYAKGLHPTMEEQVELAKRISNSLSDISNKTSKGQSMYVNRKKRSVKWVHEGEGQDSSKQNGVTSASCGKRSPLKLLMNPHGQVQDITTLRRQGYDIEAALSPDVCLEIVKDLNSPKGKGAELFAKRRKRSEKWVVGETNGSKQDNLADVAPSPLTLPSHTPLPPIQTSLPTPGYLPETTERMQHHQKLDEIQERFTRPRVKLIKSPWDAALETGSVEAAFENVPPVWPTRGAYVAPVVDSYEQALKTDSLSQWRASPANGYGDKVYAHNPAYNSNSINRIVDNLQKGVSSVDVYKPKFPQAWNSKPAKQQYYSSTLPRSKPKTPASPSPSFKASAAAPPVFIPKETSTTPSSYATQSNYYPQESVTFTAEPTTPKIDLNNLQNYNTAPRGWGQIKDVYRPVTFDKPKSSYTDF